MSRADYEVGTLESKVQLEVNNAIRSLDALISKVEGVSSVLKSALNIEGIKEITQFTNTLNKIPNALNEINKVDMTKVDSQFMSLGNTVSTFTNQLKEANTMANSTQTVLQSITSSFNALPSSISKIQGIDNKKLYGSLSSTSRATTEFTGNLYTSLSNIPNALKEVQKMDLKSLYNSFDSMTRMLEPFTTKMNKTFEGMTDSITPFIDKVKELNTELGKMNGLAENVGDSSEKSISKTKKVIDENSKQNKKIGFLDFTDALKSTVKLGVIFGALRKGFNTVKDITNASIDMIETTNLFEVSMEKVIDQYGNLDEVQSQYYTKAMAFQEQMNEKLGTNKSEMQKYQAMYYGMLNAQLGSENRDKSYFMSENLTKAGYDIASLWDLDVGTAMNKLKSGLAGQIESLRLIGIDVSEASLSRILDRVGIERSVQQLSYAEKEVARYIAIVEQAGQAQGDFARTFEQPANQIRVFQNQLAELRSVAGSFFVGLFGQIMPVINGIIMAIKEVLKALGEVFGFKVDAGNSSLGGVSDTVGDIGSGLGDATKKAKELKKQLMGFDEINNITPPSESSGGSGGVAGSVGGIDSRLLDSLKEWNNQMDKISGKAQEIRNKILDWLGVTDGSYNNLKKVWEVVKNIGSGLIGWKFSKKFLDFMQNLGVWKKLNAFQMAFGIGLSIAGIWAMWNGTKRLLNGDVDIFSLLETFLGMGAGTFGIVNILRSIKNGSGEKIFSQKESFKMGFGVSLAIQGFEVALDGIKKGDIGKSILGIIEGAGGLSLSIKTLLGNTSVQQAITNMGKWFNTLGENITTFTIGSISKLKLFSSNLKTAVSGGVNGIKGFASSLMTGTSGMSSFVKTGGTLVAGLAGIAGGSALSYATMKDFTVGAIGSTEAITKLTASLGLATASGVLAGSQFGTVGMIIGGIAGLTTSAVTAFMGYKDGIESLNIPTTTLTDGIKALTEELENNRKAHENNVKSIKDTWENQLVEAEYAEKLSQQLKGLVDANGKVKKGNEERVNFILNELNEALGTEYELNGNVITKNGEVVKSYEGLQKSIKDTVETKKKEAEQTAITELYKESIKEQIRLERDKAKAQKEYAKAEAEYNKLMAKGLSDWTLTHDENCKEIIQNYIDTADALNNTRDKYWEVTDEVSYYSQQMTNNIIENTGKLSAEMVTQQQVSTEKLQEMVTTSTETWEQTYNELNTTQQSAMLAQSTTLDNWSPTIQQKWADMANNASNDFLNGIAQVEPAVQNQILSSLSTTENLTPQMVTAWGNLSNKSFTEFASALSKVEPDVQDKILASITTTQGLTPTMQLAWSALAETSEGRFNDALSSLDEGTKGHILASIIAVNGMNEASKKAYENLSHNSKIAFNCAMNDMDEDARNKVQSAINKINSKQWEAGNAGGNVGRNVRSRFEGDLGDTTSSANNFLRGFLNVVSQSNPLGILGTIGKLASSFVNRFNKGLGNASPSKKTRQSAIYFMKGFTNQISALENNSLKQVKELAKGLTQNFDDNLGIAKLGQGIKINTKDFEVDTNQYINYSAIKGQILAQSQVNINENIADRIAEESYNAFMRAMKHSKIKVEVEGKADKDGIFKIVQAGAREYIMQTGEPAFE